MSIQAVSTQQQQQQPGFILEEKNQSLVKGKLWSYGANKLNGAVFVTTAATVATGAFAGLTVLKGPSDLLLPSIAAFAVCFGTQQVVSSIAHKCHRNADYHLSYDKFELRPV